MKLLLQSIGQLNPRQKIVAVALLLIVLLTWLGVCAILGSYLLP